jgi:hypothetical protein
MAESMKDKLLRTRANHLEASLIVSADMLALAEGQPSAFRDPDMASVLLTTGKHAALAGGWQDQAPTPKVNLGAVSVHQEPVTIEAEIVSEPTASLDLSDY